MEWLLCSVSSCEIQSVICFLTVEQVPTSEVYSCVFSIPRTFRLFLFPLPKADVGAKRFAQTVDVEAYTRKFFTKFDTLQYALGIHKFIHQYDKCLNVYGNYIEKWMLSRSYYIFLIIFICNLLFFLEGGMLFWTQPSYNPLLNITHPVIHLRLIYNNVWPTFDLSTTYLYHNPWLICDSSMTHMRLVMHD